MSLFGRFFLRPPPDALATAERYDPVAKVQVKGREEFWEEMKRWKAPK